MHRATKNTIAATITAVVIATIIAGWPDDASAGVYIHDDAGKPHTQANVWMRSAKVVMPDADVTLHADATLPLEECGNSADAHVATGCAYTNDGTRFIIVLWGGASRTDRRVTLMHELGHVFDHVTLNDAQRIRFGWLAGRGGIPWTDGTHDVRTSETFARTYAACGVLGPRLRGGRTGTYGFGDLDYFTTYEQHRKSCRLIDRASLGTGLLDR